MDTDEEEMNPRHPRFDEVSCALCVFLRLNIQVELYEHGHSSPGFASNPPQFVEPVAGLGRPGKLARLFPDLLAADLGRIYSIETTDEHRWTQIRQKESF